MAELNVSPSTRAYAARQGVDLDRLAEETGRTTLGREDVDARLSDPGAAPSGAAPAPRQMDAARAWEVDHSAWGPVAAEPLSGLARTAARNLAAAQAMIPAVTHHDEAEVTVVERFRKAMAGEARARGVKLTALAFHVKALARGLRRFPRFNASLSADGETLWLKQYVHIGLAVDTPRGLLVPVIRDADRKGLWAIAAEIADLAGRAQSRRLAPGEMGGASMTISNLGGIGGTGFTPIVNPPEVAILGLSRSRDVTVWEAGTPRPVPMVPMDLSYDHRVINGADAARFLAHHAHLIQDPRHMMI